RSARSGVVPPRQPHIGRGRAGVNPTPTGWLLAVSLRTRQPQERIRAGIAQLDGQKLGRFGDGRPPTGQRLLQRRRPAAFLVAGWRRPVDTNDEERLPGRRQLGVQLLVLADAPKGAGTE